MRGELEIDRPHLADWRLVPRVCTLFRVCWCGLFLELQLRVNLRRKLRYDRPTVHLRHHYLHVLIRVLYSSGTVRVCPQHEEHALLALVRLEGSGSAQALSSVRSLPPLLARSLGLARDSELREQQTREQQQPLLFLYYEAAAARRRSAAGRDAAWDAVAFDRRAPTAEQIARIHPPLEVPFCFALLSSTSHALVSIHYG